MLDQTTKVEIQRIFHDLERNPDPVPMWRNQEIPGVLGNEGLFFDSTSTTASGNFVRGILPMGTNT